ncbi:MAG: hypothetical protein QM601_09170 [Pseudoxanthomonas sp.]
MQVGQAYARQPWLHWDNGVDFRAVDAKVRTLGREDVLRVLAAKSER